MSVDHLQKLKKEFKFSKKQEIQNIFIKAYLFQHDMAYGNFEHFTRRTASRNYIMRNLIFAKNLKYDGYQRDLTLIVYNFVSDKSAVTHSGTGINTDFVSENQELANDWKKPAIRKFKKCKIYSSFRDAFYK